MKWLLSATTLLLLVLDPVTGFGVTSMRTKSSYSRSSMALSESSGSSTASTDAFSAFADTLEEPEEEESFDEDLDKSQASWQASLDELLDPATPLAQRQILLSDLLSANEKIRESVQAALRDGKIDPLLTPKSRKLQDGTRAVARQITNDILPGIAAATQKSPQPPADLPTLLPKVGSSIFNAISNQAKRNFEMLQGDLQDPSRIPQRLTRQIESVGNEAKNIFSETPEGLVGPAYKVVEQGEGYEIREYEGYMVASTNMAKVDEPYSVDDLASGGAAFNTLAAYLFGANAEGKTMAMTTPVTTTSLGEMRFYLTKDSESEEEGFPDPLQEDANGFYEKGAVKIVDVPPARLAVARFTGFVTKGEVCRQKDALLSRLELDGIEIDVAHGAVVPHVVFQYNPPYTIPIVRRNEIAVPVRRDGDESNNLKTEWDAITDNAAPNGSGDTAANADSETLSDTE